MPTSETFEKLYAKLNSAQKKAVDTIDGPVMVVAGPGTGKTQILALRIAAILAKTDTAPESILALTFTESGVHSMRSRLIQIIGNSAYKIPIYTFHGFANQVIKSHPDAFPRIIGSSAMTDIDQIRIIQAILDSTPELSLLRPYGDSYFYIRPILSVLKHLKREALSPEMFSELITIQEKDFKNIPDLIHEKGAHKGKMKGAYADLQKKIEKNHELALVFQKYEEALVSERLYDYEDMIIETVKALQKSEELLLKLQEEYQYILADEHQDTNQAQNMLLKLLSGFHENPNLFIVGDEKQAIFRFQGASLDNFLYFKKLYPETVLISLTDNYRSTQHILDGAHSLIEKNAVEDASLRKRLVAAAQRTQGAKIIVAPAVSRVQEYKGVVEGIQEKIAQEVSAGEIAVIYRENKDVLELIPMLEKAKVPFVVHSDRNVLSEDDIQKFILLLRAAHEIGNNERIAKALHIDFLGIPPLDAYKLYTHSSKTKIAVCDLLGDTRELEAAGIKNVAALETFCTNLTEWAKMAKNMKLNTFVERIASESGFLSHMLDSENAIEKAEHFGVFFREVEKVSESKAHATLSDFLEYIDLLESHGILLKAPVVTRSDAVNLMTAHKSKGLEFEYVYIVGAYDGHWGNKRDIRYFHIPVKGLQSVGVDPLEDERRLFYVALTRAKKEVCISYSTQAPDGKELLPSQFVTEIDPALVETISKHEHASATLLVQGLNTERPQAPGINDREYLRTLFLSQGLSVTALNAYLRCPWNYFFNNLLRLPKAKEKHQLYGTAVHETLKAFFDRYRIEEDMTREECISLFEQYLEQKHLSEIDHKESLEKGRNALGGYFDFYKGSWPRTLLAEYVVPPVPFEIKYEGKPYELLLRGNVDKVEFGEGERVNVIDYKTGTPRSRNSIMGATKTSDGDYYRQLLFYKLLLDTHDSGKMNMVSGTIDFIEPEKSGKYKRELFEISSADTEPLQELIKQSAQEILSFSFWNKTCDDKTCDYCKLRRMIKE